MMHARLRCLRAVLEVMDEMPVTQGSEGDGGDGESPSTQHHLVVRRDSEGEREASVVPDSQDEEEVGEVAATLRKLRKPDPYKGKGVRYEGEVIRRKAGKAGR